MYRKNKSRTGFKSTNIVRVISTEAYSELVESPVRCSTSRKYHSCANTLRNFLRTYRNLPDTAPVDITSFEESELVAFLVNWKRQGLASPRLYHAALAHFKLQAAKREAWLHTREIQKLVKGAGVNGERNEKGVLTCEMLRELCNYIENRVVLPTTCMSCNQKGIC